MTYVPVYCEECEHASLSEHSSVDRRVFCSFCERPARVIPGPAFGDGDWLAFAELDRAVHAAALDGLQATALGERLQALEDASASPATVVGAMLEGLPELRRARPALVNGLQRGLRILKTLLAARARNVASELRRPAVPLLVGSSDERSGHWG